MAGTARRPSLVDSAEEALRGWLLPGHHRPGDRLPPEHDLAAMLGVSRGTLRTVLQRLEGTGEIIRRQGSGTFVGQLERPAAFGEGLERLESYSSLARRRGVRLEMHELEIARVPVGPHVGGALDLPAETPAPTISRVVLADGRPAAHMVDVVHPDLALPGDAELREALHGGDMVLDVLTAAGAAIAFAHTRVTALLVRPGEHPGSALGVPEPTAVLELEEVMHTTAGEAVQHSRDLFAPKGVDLHVMRWVGPGRPPPVGGRPE
jgi:GntR family transcriptional regulator